MGLSPPSGGGGGGNSYTPATAGDWKPTPSTYDSALDQLANKAILPGGRDIYSIPVLSNFAWLNQLTATISMYKNRAASIVTPGYGSENWQLQLFNLVTPFTAFTVTVALTNQYLLSGLGVAGIVARNSGTGRFVSLYLGEISAALVIKAGKHPSPTAYDGDLIGQTNYYLSQIVWLRISFNGTDTITFSYSLDGIGFCVCTTTPLSDYVVAIDQVGWGCNYYAGGVCNCWSWEVTQP